MPGFRRDLGPKGDPKIDQKSRLFLRALLEGFWAQKGAQRTPNGSFFGALLAPFLRRAGYHEKCDSVMQNAYFCLPREVQKGSKIDEKNVAETGAPKVRLLDPKVVPKGPQRLPKRGPKIIKNPCLGHVLATLGLKSPPGADFGPIWGRFGVDLGAIWDRFGGLT